MKRVLLTLLIMVVAMAAFAIGATVAKDVKSAISPPQLSEDSREIRTALNNETIDDIVFDASAELSSVLLSLQSMIVPHTIEFEFGNAEYGQVHVLIDGPVPEMTVLVLTIFVGVAIMWRLRK